MKHLTKQAQEKQTHGTETKPVILSAAKDLVLQMLTDTRYFAALKMTGLASARAIVYQVDLRNRRGEGFVTAFMLFLPLALVLLNLSVNGLAIAYGYRQAAGLAQLAATTGAGAIVFDGGRVMLAPDEACDRARQALLTNGAETLAGFKSVCKATARDIHVAVMLKPTLVLGDVFQLAPERISAEARSRPIAGINEPDVSE
jgi:hypothetical protein